MEGNPQSLLFPLVELLSLCRLSQILVPDQDLDRDHPPGAIEGITVEVQVPVTAPIPVTTRDKVVVEDIIDIVLLYLGHLLLRSLMAVVEEF